MVNVLVASADPGSAWSLPFPSIPPLPCRLASQIRPRLLTAWQMLKDLLGGKSNFNAKLNFCLEETGYLPALPPVPSNHRAQNPGLQRDSAGADIGLSGNLREAPGLGERSCCRGEGSRQPESLASPPPSGCFQTRASITCVRPLQGVLPWSPSSWGSAYGARSTAWRVI